MGPGNLPRLPARRLSEVLARDVGPGAARLELEIGAPQRSRVAMIAELFVGHGEVEVRVGEAGVGLDRALKIADRDVELVALEHQVAEVVFRFGLAWVEGERLRVERLGGDLVSLAEEDVAE